MSLRITSTACSHTEICLTAGCLSLLPLMRVSPMTFLRQQEFEHWSNQILFFSIVFTFQEKSSVCLLYQQAFITKTGNCTFTEFPQPIISVKLSFQQRLQGYISGRRLMSSRGTLVILCLEIMSSIFTP